MSIILQKIILKLFKIVVFASAVLGARRQQRVLYSYLKKSGVNMAGKPNYISPDVDIDTSRKNMVSIDSGVVISKRVIILAHDFSISKAREAIEGTVKRKIAFREKVIIERDVFIGAGTIILSGSVIHRNTIIGAGSLVKGEIEGYSVYCGNPARKLCSIDDYYNKHKSKIASLIN